MISKGSYFLLWLNAASAFLMTQYMLYGGATLLVCLFPWLTSGIAYYYGYRYASTGQAVARKPFLILFAVYTGFFAIPPLSRFLWLNFHALMFAYECARLLMFRAAWLTLRREAYLHLLAYFIVVCACMGHFRADFTLYAILPLYSLTLMAALFSLYRDSLFNINRRPSVIALIRTAAAILFISVQLRLLLPSGKWWDFKLVPQAGPLGSLAPVSPGQEGIFLTLIRRLQREQLQANPESPLGVWLQAQLAKLEQSLATFPDINSSHLLVAIGLLLLAGLLLVLWQRRHTILLAARVYLVDPVHIAMLAEKRSAGLPEAITVYRAYERVCAHCNVARRTDQTPSEHIESLRQTNHKFATIAAEMTLYFQRARYGKQPVDISALLTSYIAIRNSLKIDIAFLFDKTLLKKLPEHPSV